MLFLYLKVPTYHLPGEAEEIHEIPESEYSVLSKAVFLTWFSVEHRGSAT
jgi:hypothetical protein